MPLAAIERTPRSRSTRARPSTAFERVVADAAQREHGRPPRHAIAHRHQPLERRAAVPLGHLVDENRGILVVEIPLVVADQDRTSQSIRVHAQHSVTRCRSVMSCAANRTEARRIDCLAVRHENSDALQPVPFRNRHRRRLESFSIAGHFCLKSAPVPQSFHKEPARALYGLSVITIAGSTTKKIAEAAAVAARTCKANSPRIRHAVATSVAAVLSRDRCQLLRINDVQRLGGGDTPRTAGKLRAKKCFAG